MVQSVLPRHILNPRDCVLLVIDIQEKFLGIVQESAQLVYNARILIETAMELDIPIIISEQYPKGLGYTDATLIKGLPPNTKILEKTAFGCLGDSDIRDTLASYNRKQVIVCGIEAHVCVNQTVHQLLEAGYEVHLVEDAVSARSPKNLEVGLDKMHQSGVIPSSVEMVLFELMQDAKHPSFKKLQSLIK